MCKFGLFNGSQRPSRNIEYSACLGHSLIVLTHAAAERGGDILEIEWADTVSETRSHLEGRTPMTTASFGFFAKQGHGQKEYFVIAPHITGSASGVAAAGLNLFKYDN